MDVILVDDQDRKLGVAEKMQAHREGWLHRAFSTFIFNSRGELLLQRRARAKYHSGGLWSNACCGHPLPGEATTPAAQRRLREELGFEVPLEEAFSFVYRATLDHGLTEHEYDHAHVGRFDGVPRPDPSEIEECHWFIPVDLLEDVAANERRYTQWFCLLLPRILEWRGKSRFTRARR